MNALKWIAGILGYLVVFALVEHGFGALGSLLGPHWGSYLRVIAILLIGFVAGGIVIGEVASRYR